MSLNIWAGKEFTSLVNYLSSKSDEIDIFCFQEVFDTTSSEKIIDKYYRANIFQEISKILPNHKGYFASAQESHGFNKEADFPISWGIAMFIKNNLEINKMSESFIRGHKNSKGVDNTTVPRNIQCATVFHKGKEYNLAHFHGLWNGKGKADTDERIEQSQKVRKVIDGRSNVVLCGDFNLLPETRSLEILEENLTNLIKTNNIRSTRSKLYPKPNKFADYMLVSKGIEVKEFTVDNVEVSDHLPIILDFS
jgi:endonuclease/exonuclease/phosphatase family metal-dependent hydrolase